MIAHSYDKEANFNAIKQHVGHEDPLCVHRSYFSHVLLFFSFMRHKRGIILYVEEQRRGALCTLGVFCPISARA
jgi:hypothetical protein